MYDDLMNIHYAIAPAIWAAIAIGSALLSNTLQNNANKEAQAAQNDYNSPRMQMARYASAGLNPNLIYSQGNPGNQATPVQLRAPDIAGDISKYANIPMAKRQMDLLDSQIDKTNADAAASWTNANAANKDFISKLSNGVQKTEFENYWDQSVKYQLQMQQQAMRNAMLTGGEKAVNIDLKKDVHKTKSIQNEYRDYGVEPSDNFLFRAGVRFASPVKEWYNQNLRR